MRPDWIDVFGGFIVGCIIATMLYALVRETHRETLQDEAAHRGYAEYVIKDKQAVWQWKEIK